MRDRNQFREAWLQRHEAVAVVRQYLQCSIGKAEALIDRAVASGEVRTEQAAIQDFTCKTGNRVKAITRYSMDDLLALLNSGDDLLALLKPQIPQQQPPAKTTARTKAIREAAGRAITAIFGNRIPSQDELPNKQLHSRVCEWLAADCEKRKIPKLVPSPKTVRLAAGRK